MDASRSQVAEIDLTESSKAMINLEVVYVNLLNKCERREIVSTNMSRI